MNRFRKAVLALCLALFVSGIQVQAAEPYTYTVTFYAGDKGSFTGAGVQVKSQSDSIQVSPASDGSRITVTGLETGDRVGLLAASGGVVTLGNSGKYYVRGIRKSGYDNNTVAAASFEVTEDADYVVAYGIRGNMAAYTVHFQDRSGRTLAESQTYYGNVGDKPVVAFLYMEGYVPETYNLTKTLVSDEAQNVFTFVYSPISDSAVNPAAPTVAPAETTAAGTPGQPVGTPAQPGTPTQPSGEAGEPSSEASGPSGAAGTESTEATGEPPLLEVPDESVPQELVDLDDEKTPLADLDLSDDQQTDSETTKLHPGVIAAVSAALLLGLGLCFFWIKKKKKKKNT